MCTLPKFWRYNKIVSSEFWKSVVYCKTVLINRTIKVLQLTYIYVCISLIVLYVLYFSCKNDGCLSDAPPPTRPPLPSMYCTRKRLTSTWLISITSWVSRNFGPDRVPGRDIGRGDLVAPNSINSHHSVYIIADIGSKSMNRSSTNVTFWDPTGCKNFC